MVPAAFRVPYEVQVLASHPAVAAFPHHGSCQVPVGSCAVGAQAFFPAANTPVGQAQAFQAVVAQYQAHSFLGSAAVVQAQDAEYRDHKFWAYNTCPGFAALVE